MNNIGELIEIADHMQDGTLAEYECQNRSRAHLLCDLLIQRSVPFAIQHTYKNGRLVRVFRTITDNETGFRAPFFLSCDA